MKASRPTGKADDASPAEPLRDSEERFRLATQVGKIGVWDWDIVADQILWSESLYTIYGVEPGIRRSIEDFRSMVHPEDRDTVNAAIRGALEHDTPNEIEYRAIRPDGNVIWLFLTAKVIRSKGRPIRMLGSTLDITERKRVEMALRESIDERRKFEEELRLADRRKDEFLATLAHELRNPLAPIGNGIEFLKTEIDTSGRNARVLEIMDRQLAQMVRLVDDLLDVSRISRGKIELRAEPIALSDAVRSALETSQPAIEKAGHRLVVDVPDPDIVVHADLTRLSQVLANLLSNAAKYSPRGSVLRIAVETDGTEVVIRVRDNGIGIPAALLPQVFDLFTRGDTSLEKSESGLGIGLTIVKRLVEMHGGSVEAHSEGEGKGSEFVVRLPQLLSTQASEASPVEAKPIAHARRVLVVDDNRDSAESMAMVLGNMGHETRVAHDGREALEVAESYRPDMILLDIGMPIMNGYEACRRLRQMPWGRDVLVVAMTGWGHLQDREHAREAGFDHHLTKPVDFASLQELLAERSDANRRTQAPAAQVAKDRE